MSRTYGVIAEKASSTSLPSESSFFFLVKINKMLRMFTIKVTMISMTTRFVKYLIDVMMISIHSICFT